MDTTKRDELRALLAAALAAHNATVGTSDMRALMRKNDALVDLSDAAIGALPALLDRLDALEELANAVRVLCGTKVGDSTSLVDRSALLFVYSALEKVPQRLAALRVEGAKGEGGA